MYIGWHKFIRSAMDTPLMPAKVRLLTRSFDLSVEGENVEEVEKLMDALRERGFMLAKRGPEETSGTKDVVSEVNADIVSVSDDTAERAQELTSAALTGLDAFAGPAAASGRGESLRVLKRDKDTFTLAHKFPPKADGTDRTDAAAMVLLLGYDRAGEAPVTGARLAKSLRQTGYGIDRLDREMEELTNQSLVLSAGVRRGRRYSLSEAGRAEARKLADELAAIAGRPAGGA